jgi:putative oxidoreductase
MAEDFGKLVLRLGVGGLMLFHGIHKLLTGVTPVKDALTGNGWPEALAYGVYVGEIVGPLLVVLGLLARFGAFLIAVEVAALAALGGFAHFLTVAPDGGYAAEVAMFYFLGALAVLLLGPGKLAIAKGKYD